MSVEPRAVRDLGAHRHLVVSERLRERRRDLGLTQKEVVSRLRRIGVDTTNKALSSLEHGAGLDVAKLPELACALDCTLTYLLGLTDAPERWQPDPGQWPEPPRRPVPPAAAAAPRALPQHPGDHPVPLPRILGPVNADWPGRRG
jgi:transcriptional regulator with XRE-family HTH domain